MSRLPFSRTKQQSPEEPVEQPELEYGNEDGQGARMGFFEHLDELRKRVFRAAIALIFGTLIGIALAGQALDYLRTPYCEAVANDQIIQADAETAAEDGVVAVRDCRFQIIGPTGSVVAYFRVSLMIGAIIAIPMITYQFLMFILPGLTRKEKRLILLSLPAITGLFLIGAAFSWFVLMRPALGFLEGFQPTLFRPEWTADLYLSFVTSLIFWMGVAFETPLVFFVLGLLGIVGTRALITNWRLAIVGASVAAAFITPTIDPVNMFLVMGPLLMLYVLSIFLVFVARRISRIDENPYA